MTQMPPSPPHGPGPLDDLYPAEPAPAPLSSTCVAALVCSLLVCIPLVTQLVGLILGILGLGYTSGGKARGRGLAIAALVISPLAALAWCGAALFWVALIIPIMTLDNDLAPLWSDDNVTMTQAAAAIHQTVLSERLKVRVDQTALLTYSQQVVARYGQVKSIKPSPTMLTNRQDDVGWILHLDAQFAEGPTNLSVLIGLDGFAPQIDNITVGDLTLAPDQ